MISILFLAIIGQMPSPVSLDSLQLQQLVNQSEEQLKALKDILSSSKADNDSLRKASGILERMSNGIEKSIEAYQGTPAYEQALVEIQKKNDFSRSYGDTGRVREITPVDHSIKGLQDELDGAFEDLKKFQKDSVNANVRDIDHLNQLQKALNEAGPGFVPKIEAQAQIGNWQASTRVSAQMTELIATIHAMREELRAMRMAKSSGGLGSLIQGAEQQSQLLEEGKSGGSRKGK